MGDGGSQKRRVHNPMMLMDDLLKATVENSLFTQISERGMKKKKITGNSK